MAWKSFLYWAMVFLASLGYCVMRREAVDWISKTAMFKEPSPMVEISMMKYELALSMKWPRL